MATARNNASEIVKQGYLFVKRPPRKCWEKLKAWHERYFVLRDETEDSSPHIEMYDIKRKMDRFDGLTPKMILNLDQCVHIGYTTESTRFPYAFILVCQGKSPMLLATEDELETRSWILALSLITHKEYGKSVSKCLTSFPDNKQNDQKQSSVDNSTGDGVCSNWKPCTSLTEKKETTCRLGDLFQVTIQPTEASQKSGLNGDYRLVVCRHGVGLAKSRDTECFILWPVAYLRQFRHQVLSTGWSRATIVTLDVGRRCSTGEGIFQFRTQKGQEIIRELKKMVELWSSRKAAMGRRHSRQEAEAISLDKKLVPRTPSISLPQPWQKQDFDDDRSSSNPMANDDLNYIVPVIEHSPVLSKRKLSCDIIKGRLLHPLSAQDGSTMIGRSMPTTPECVSLNESHEFFVSDVIEIADDVKRVGGKNDIEDEGYIEVLPTDLQSKDDPDI